MKDIKQISISKEYVEGFVKLISPIVPHIAEELWSILGHEDTIVYESWPTFDESKLVDNEVEIPVQIKGKVRAKLLVAKDATKDELEALALASEQVQQWLEGQEVKKIIAIPGKMVNIVI